MFRTFQLLAREYLGEITLLIGEVAPTNLKVKHLKYKSPRRGFPAFRLVVEDGRQLLVREEGEEWNWATEPPPLWKTGEGIPYDLQEALETRQGRPYGYDENAWQLLKTNFMRHATHKQKEFPNDFYINVKQEYALKKQEKEEGKKRREKRAKIRERKLRRKERQSNPQREQVTQLFKQ